MVSLQEVCKKPLLNHGLQTDRASAMTSPMNGHHKVVSLSYVIDNTTVPLQTKAAAKDPFTNKVLW